jgi:hypothetical protein
MCSVRWNMLRRPQPLLLALLLVFTCAVTLHDAALTLAQGGEADWLLVQVNGLRAQSGLGALAWNAQLAAAAAGHSQYLATSPYVGPHVQADGSTPESRAAAQGYGGRVGENVVGGSSATQEWAWNWWLNSSVHRSNMLGDWNEIGIAAAAGGYGRWYTIVFGKRGGAPPPAVNPVPSTPGGAGSSGGAPVAQPPRNTRPPRPTDTPTITLTPSMTFTPRASYTPLPTITPLPPTETPIEMEVVLPGATGTLPPLPLTQAPTQLPAPPSVTLPPAVALVATAAPQDTPAPLVASPPESGNGTFRALIPVLMVAQLALVVALAVRSALRRGR